MIWLFLMMAVSIGCVYAAETVEWLKKRPVVTGAMFGAVSVLAEIIAAYTDNVSLLSGIVAVHPVIVMFFFNPVSGVVACAISAFSYFVPYAAAMFSGIVSVYCAFATSTIFLCSFFTKKLFFHEKRPGLVVLLVTLVYYGVFHVLLYFFFGFFTPDLVLVDIYNDFWPFFFGMLIPGMLAGIFLKLFGSQRIGLPWKEVWFLLLTDFGLLGIIGLALYMGDKQTCTALTQDFGESNYSLKRQANFFLRRTALRILDQHRDLKKYSPGQLRQLVQENELDEINIIDSTGHVVSSSDPNYEKMQDDSRDTVVDFNRHEESAFSRVPMIETEFLPKPGNGSSVPRIVRTEWRGKIFSNPVKNGMIYRSAASFNDGSGYAEFGVSQKRLLRDFDRQLLPLLKERSVSENGFFVFCSPEGKIALPVARHSKNRMCDQSVYDFADKTELTDMEELTPRFILFEGTLCRCIKIFLADGWTLYGLLPLSEFCSHDLALASFCNFILLAFLFGMQFMRYRSSHLFNQVVTLEREKKHHQQSDLMLIRELQQSELREHISDTKYTLIYSYIKPVEEVGGDFYDYFITKDRKFVCLVADVSGEGLPAAFYMLKAKLAIREIISECSDLETAISKVNERLCNNNHLKLFVTLWIGMLDPLTGEVQYISAGHNPTLIYHAADGSLTWTEPTNSLALGITPMAVYRKKSFFMKPQDKGFLYTDGVTEARNVKGELFTANRLKEVLAGEKGNFIVTVNHELEKFTRHAKQADDITMVQMLYKGNPDAPAAADHKA